MTYKIVQRGITTFIFAVIFCSFGFQSVEAEEDLQQQINSLEQKQKQLDQEAQKYRNQVAEKQKEVNTFQNALYIINSDIDRASSELEATVNEIELTELELKQLSLEIHTVEGKLLEQKTLLSEVIRTMYQMETESLIEVFLKNESLSEFLSQAQYLESANLQLRELVDSLRSFGVRLNGSKEDREKKRVDLMDLQGNIEVQRDVLTGRKQEKDSLLSLSKKEQGEYQSKLSAVEKERSKLLSDIRELEAEVSRRKNFLSFLESNTIPEAGTKLFRWPERDPILTQGYGYTSFAKKGSYGGSPHNGIDMVSGHGSPILAAADGVVLAAGTNKGWGNWIALKHAGDLVTLYGHMRAPTHRTQGESVSVGQVIGYEGKTGNSTGSHLHFSVYSKFFTFMSRGELYFNYFEGTLNPLDYL